LDMCREIKEREEKSECGIACLSLLWTVCVVVFSIYQTFPLTPAALMKLHIL